MMKMRRVFVPALSLTTTDHYTFCDASADTEEVLQIIISLYNSKASGPNSIPTEILKLLGPSICRPLKEIINISFATGIYPDEPKLA